MGKVQTSCRGSTKQAVRWTWMGVCVGQGTKETQTAQDSKEHRRNSGVRTDSRGTVGTAPRARTTDLEKGGVAADIFGHTAPQRHTEKWVMQ